MLSEYKEEVHHCLRKVEAVCGVQRKLEAGCGTKSVFHGQDAGCFEIDGGIVDHKNHLMTEKTPNNDHLYERNDNFCISGLPVTSVRPCPRPPPLLPLALGPLGPVTIKPYKERLAWRACLSKVIQLQSPFDLSGVECEMAWQGNRQKILTLGEPRLPQM